MELTKSFIVDTLQQLSINQKAIFKNKEGKAKVFFLKNNHYFITFDGHEIETITDISAVVETVLALLKMEE
ncbi:MAG: hypothetical protein MUF58_12210 [Arcicella sp.]|jgi:hypothetical protein|nr:hypothetical protein [Arcicella sp.]